MNYRDFLRRYRKDPRFIITVPLVILAATSLVYYLIQETKSLTPEAFRSFSSSSGTSTSFSSSASSSCCCG
jgi:hypothetical protein